MISSIDFIFSDRGILPWRQEEARDQHADDTTYLIRIWEQLKPHRPEREGVRGVAARDDRLFINAVLLDIANRRAMEISPAGLWRFAKGVRFHGITTSACADFGILWKMRFLS